MEEWDIHCSRAIPLKGHLVGERHDTSIHISKFSDRPDAISLSLHPHPHGLLAAFLYLVESRWFSLAYQEGFIDAVLSECLHNTEATGIQDGAQE